MWNSEPGSHAISHNAFCQLFQFSGKCVFGRKMPFCDIQNTPRKGPLFDAMGNWNYAVRRTVFITRLGFENRPYSPVGESASTVNIDRDRSTGSINQWVGVDIWIGVGTISHHTWDHDFLVDECLRPFHTTYRTIGQLSFFPTSRKNAVNRFFWV